MQLDLSRKGYAYIPEDLDEHVTSLSLSANRICSLSDVGRLVHLRRVDLSCNKIVALAGIEVLGALVWLNLSRNSITSLDGVQHLAHLQTLDVADNNLTDIDVLEHNMSLTHVNASTNCINVWPRLTLLVHLEVLNLNENELPALRLLHTMLPPHVQQLHLAHNHIDHLHCFDSCRPMLSLHTLDLAGNGCAANHALAMATLSSIFPSLTTFNGQPVMRTTPSQQSPPTPPQHTPDLDVSNRDVKIQMWKHMLQQRSQQETVDRLRLQQERQQVGPATPRDEETRPTLRPPSMATPRPQYFVHHNHAAAPPTTSKQITPR
ncbi:hypothetical protein H257_13096 [Aphanomyces astaci]|uniref:Uncharacterized protein n=1 Tax=Aphanomyces astaci TaxID=112090 RepID=W4FXH4_APHAT|nr:hypothetical protein H257_13096 [Aphanomyces astaci]ETV71641.1 hypothetical protein H257_13096 [Aphanomyces astaci]|eukprot:XP_009838829.1 hypothetical protein H257_13096 [Aphanomyces astaci]